MDALSNVRDRGLLGVILGCKRVEVSLQAIILSKPAGQSGDNIHLSQFFENGSADALVTRIVFTNLTCRRP